MTIRYADGTAGLAVRLIYSWKRGDLTGAVMSASSGPKDYVKNQIWEIFAKYPEVDRVVIVRASGPAFALFRHESGSWHDVSGKPVISEGP